MKPHQRERAQSACCEVPYGPKISIDAVCNAELPEGLEEVYGRERSNMEEDHGWFYDPDDKESPFRLQELERRFPGIVKTQKKNQRRRTMNI